MIAIHYRTVVMGRVLFMQIKHQVETLRGGGAICAHKGVTVGSRSYPEFGCTGKTVLLRGVSRDLDNRVSSMACSSERTALEYAEVIRQAILKAVVTLHRRGFLRNENAGN